MMREEAIAILIREKDEDPFMRTEYRKQIHEALNMGIEALKQAEHFDGVWINTHDKDEWWTEVMICPICKKEQVGGNYCTACGAHLKNEDSEDGTYERNHSCKGFGQYDDLLKDELTDSEKEEFRKINLSRRKASKKNSKESDGEMNAKEPDGNM